MNKVSKTVVDENPRPDWAYNRPIDGSYYIGIGSANKLSFPSDYSIIAKKNALTDMSSEITVKVSGESFYHTIDRNKEYSEEFQSMIRSTFKEEIENYEIVDSWENDREFWIFTRISKAKHTQLKSEKKTAILDEAYQNYNQALDYSTNGKPADALDLLSNALLGMKEYWAESNLYNAGSESIHLDNTIYNEIRSICSGIELKVNTNQLALTYKNGYSNQLSVAVKKDDLYLSGIPIRYKFSNAPYSLPKVLFTNSEGLVTIHSENFNGQRTGFQLDVWVDYEDLLENQSSAEMSGMLLESINRNKMTVPISIALPSVYFAPLEDSVSALVKTMKNELQKNGFSVVSDAEIADLELSFIANSREGGQAQGFQVAFLDFSVLLEDHKSKRQLFADSYTNIKGIHLNLSGAQGDALNNCAKKIRKEVVPKMMQVIL